MPETDQVLALERPHRNLLKYYVLGSLMLGPLFPLAIVPLYFKYHTLRYSFDEQGVTMRWGILFRKEIALTYARLQDIHLQSNFLERWMGLAKVHLQTASGSSGAEMTIEGLQEYELIRDFLYRRMRGAHDHSDQVQPGGSEPVASAAAIEALGVALAETTEALKAVRAELLEIRSGAGSSAPLLQELETTAGDRLVEESTFEAVTSESAHSPPLEERPTGSGRS